MTDHIEVLREIRSYYDMLRLHGEVRAIDAAISALAAQGGGGDFEAWFAKQDSRTEWRELVRLAYLASPPVPVERGEDDELRLFERRNADFVDALPRKIEGSNLTQPAAHVSIDKAKLIELISASLDAAEIIQSDIRSEGARVTDALPDRMFVISGESRAAAYRGCAKELSEALPALLQQLAETKGQSDRLCGKYLAALSRAEAAERAREELREELASLQVIHNCLRRDHERSKAREEVARDASQLLRRLNDANYWNCGECLLDPEAREDIAAFLAASGGK